MKANYNANTGRGRYKHFSSKELQIIKEEADKEFAKRCDELQAKIQKDIAIQYVATVMYTLEVWYGWGAKRQRRFMNRVGESFKDMNGVGFVGSFNADDLKNHIKEKFGIDLDNEIQVEFEEGDKK